ncbi:flavocytochrome c [Psychrobacillus sp. FJAT-51614]
MESYNIIIVGAGMAGLCAAVEATSNNVRVLILEKENEIGGSSLLSGRYMAFADTDIQRQEGIRDSTEILVNDMLSIGEGSNERALVEAYGKHQQETYQWLVQNGVQFHAVQAVSGHSVPRGHQITPKQAIERLFMLAESNSNVTFILNADVKRLRKNKDGKVSEVLYRKDGKEFTAIAEDGVIIASGGFSRSETLLNAFAPQLKGALRIGGNGNLGDGIKLAWEQGAWMRDFPFLKGTYGFHPSADGPRKSQGLVFYKGAIIINEEAKRFVNESISYKSIGTKALEQPNGITYQIWDQAIMNESVHGDALYDFKKLLDLGLIEHANSLNELARKINVPENNLNETIQTYNIDVNKGLDRHFGRSTLTHNFGKLKTISEGPFYGMRTTVAMLATYAGIAVDEHARVLNPYHEPINGLYAAGESVGGFHGAGYMTGSSLGKAAIFGRIAVRTALANIPVTK